MSLASQNLLFQSLPPDLKERLSKHLERVTLPVGFVLFEAEEKPRYVHLLTSGIASVVTMMSSGEAVEVGLCGREGFPQRLHVLGSQPGGARCFVQVSATALRMEFGRFHEAFLQHPALMHAVHLYIQHDGYMLQQVAGCNRLHEVETRMARWLLMVQDRVGESVLPLTQDFLAQMLGVRRSSVNLVASTLQRSGAITYRRGKITVEDRGLLESVACECYPALSRLYQNLYK